MWDWALHHLPQLAIVFAASALAIVGAVFALFLLPKLKKVDEFVTSHAALTSHISTLKIPENLSALQRLQVDVALLQSSETQRNQRLSIAVDAQNGLIQKLQDQITDKIEAGDQENLIRLLMLKTDQLEVAYTLSKIQGGSKEEETRKRLVRAQEELAKKLDEEERPH